MTEPEKMGFETRRFQGQSYGTSEWIDVAGRRCWTQSGAERQWLRELEIAIAGGAVQEWWWQPADVAIPYRFARGLRERTYRPDAHVLWADGKDEWYEIKYGKIDQKAGNNIKRFCQTYPDRKMVLVWKGPKPTRTGTTKNQWDKILPWVDHVWYLKK
jgi:hypothetical protein